MSDSGAAATGHRPILPLPLSVGLVACAFAIGSSRVSAAASLVFLLVVLVFVCWRLSAFSPVSSITWILAYLALSTVGRGLSLIALHQPGAPIYSLLGGGSYLAEAIKMSVQDNLIGMAAFSLGVRVVRSRNREGSMRVPTMNASGLAPWIVLGAATLALPVQGWLSATTEPTEGGAFILDLPGYAALGILTALTAALFAGRRIRLTLWTFLMAYAVVRLFLIGSKFGVLAVVVAVIVGSTVSGRGKALPRLIRTTARFGLPIAALVVFSVPVLSGSSESAPLSQRLQVGADALVSRSYSLDAEMASREWLRQRGNDYLLGSSFASIAYSWVPRQLWPEKPKSFSDSFGQDMFGFSPQSGIRFFSPSYTGEWLLNFSYPGIIVGWMLFGYAARRSDLVADLGLRAVFVIVMTHMIEGSLVAQFWLAAPLVFGALLLTSRRPSSTPPSRPGSPLSEVPALALGRPEVAER